MGLDKTQQIEPERRSQESLDDPNRQVRREANSASNNSRSKIVGTTTLAIFLKQVRRVLTHREMGIRCETTVGSKVALAGQEETFVKIRRLIMRSDKVLFGIYGMGGVGKTTLLTKIKVEMGTHFDVVIWVTVSQELNVFKIQESIFSHLGYRNVRVAEGWQRARFLSSVLSRKNVLLLLDDLWEMLDLARIGIPNSPKNRSCKVVFTTRSEDVCIATNVQERFKVMPLQESDSWELFSSKISSRVGLKNNPSIEPLAREIVAKCGGLPLTLVTVASAMENAATVEEWKQAIINLKDSPNESQGLQNVHEILKLSYDWLRNDSLRWCFLYCASYPEDHEIYAPKIVNYWVGEGIFSGDNSPVRDSSGHELLNQADEVVDELIDACLLENCGDNYVKMHVRIRDMALWISSGGECDNNKSTNVIFSYAGLGLTKCPNPVAERWGEAKLISLMFNNIQTFTDDDMPDCPNLTSLLFNNNPTLNKPIPESFFSSMPNLRVLDLSYTAIEELPKSIGLLVQLCYFNLSATNITSLPVEMGSLHRLRDLRLWKTVNLETVPRREILKLSALQTLDLSYSKYIWDASEDISIDNTTAAEDLEAFTQLEDLGITIATSRFLQVLLSSHSWSDAIKSLSLQVKDLTISHLSTASKCMKSLLDLQICNALELEELTLESGQLLDLHTLRLLDLPMLRKIVLNKEAAGQILPGLRILEIGRCSLLRDFSWVHQLSTLAYITLQNCNGLEELLLHKGNIGDETDSPINCIFPNLKMFVLGWLPNLTSISNCPLLFPSLEFIYVHGCPKLKRLPFGLGSAKKIKKIMGSQRWWDGLVWKPDTIKATFLPHFTPGDEVDDVDDDSDVDEGEGSRGRDRKRKRPVCEYRLSSSQ